MDNIDMIVAMELQKPIYHTPINLGINEFKRLARSRFKDKALINKLVRSFKKRAWMEYRGVARYRGNFPTHPRYWRDVDVMVEDAETNIEVNSGRQK